MKPVESYGLRTHFILEKTLPDPPDTLLILHITPSISHNNQIDKNYKPRMIWDIIEQSTFDKHFQNPNLTIEELLVDENILTQMQNLNPQLLQFVKNNLDDVIDRLVRYVTVMPREDEGYDRCHRLPYISSEMLAIDSQIFYEVFFGNKDGKQSGHLTKLYAFLASESVDNQLLLGYFQKVTNNLYKGRKLEFTKSVAANLPLFVRNLDKETIGNLLKSCVILLGQKQGVLFQQRKKITSTLISNLVQPTNEKRQSQIRQVCSDALVEIIGRHKTFSSGDQLLNYILCFCGELLLIYSQTETPQICRFLIGLLTKSTQKIYGPESDTKVNIFRLPPQHQKLLQGYLPLYLHFCKKQAKAAPEADSTIRQQNGKLVTKINPYILDYLTLIAITLENQIDDFLLQSEEDLIFAWECMREHPRNDIALVQIVRILGYAISDRSMNRDQLHQNLLEKFKIVDRFCEIFKNKDEEKLLRPHLFGLWNKFKDWAPEELKDSNEEWKSLCDLYTSLIPLHTKATGLNYTRPTNTKIIIDQEDAKAISESNRSQNTEEKLQEFVPTNEAEDEKEKDEIKVEAESESITKEEQHVFHQQFKMEELKKPQAFNEFDYFFNGEEEKQKKKQIQADFSQFGAFE